MYAGRYKPDLELRRPRKTGATISTVNYDDFYYNLGVGPPSGRWNIINAGIQVDRTTGLMWVRAPSLIIPSGSGDTLAVGRGAYAAGTADYVAGNLVSDGGKYWICQRSLAAGVTPVEGADWKETPWAITATAGTAAQQSAVPAWATVVTNVEALNYGGYTDWRMPNAAELASIWWFNSSETSPAKFGIKAADGFSLHAADTFIWSSTYVMNDNTAAITGRLLLGVLQAYGKAAGTGFTIPVRGPVF